MPSSPQKPQQRRTSSTESVNLALPRGIPGSSIQGQRKASIGRSSPNPEILLLSGREDDSFSADRSHVADEFGGFQERKNGLGNLAEELADAWDEDGERDPAQSPHSAAALPTVASTLAEGHDKSIALSDTAHDPSGSRHQESGLRPASLDGDGSDAEDASLFSATLEAGMTAVDNLVRQESGTDGTALDGVVCRLADALRELPSQSGIENGTSRFDFHVPFAALFPIPGLSAAAIAMC
ncbi:MAG: hypothetical protein OHK93_007700 [Ramalina farinacea]|uniref:Uncharacterized protein n=1 Tax=Ramalina farinacea TaxID=258253 RepID=A0AA43QKZ6_9LECA|nr:hypothetical protein [Ramalina farinacea]